MLSEMFWIFQKKLIYKEKCETVSVKVKECKKRYKKVSYESFSSIYNYTITLFWNLALVLVLALHWYFGDNVKYRLISKHLFQRKGQYGGCKNITVMPNF